MMSLFTRLASGAGLVAIGGIAIWALNRGDQEQAEQRAPAAAAGEHDDDSSGGLLQWQQRRQRRAAAQATPRERLVANLSRALDLLALEADLLCESVFQALRRLQGDALHARLQQLSPQLEDVVTRLDMLRLGQAEDTERLRLQRRQLVSNIQAELESLDEYLQDYAAARSTMRKLNTVLDALCQQQPDFVCPITHDIMRLPVTASSGRTYEASALQAHCIVQLERGMQPTCPLTLQVLDPGQEHPNQELQSAINLAVEEAIAASGASEADQAAMWARWWRTGGGVSSSGLLQWQQRRQRHAAAQATPRERFVANPRERLVAELSRALDLLALEADDLCESVFQALRRLQGDALHARLQQLSPQLEDVVTRLDMLRLGQAEDSQQLRARRRQLVSNIQAELESLDEYLQDYAAVRSIMRKLNDVLDALCEREPDFACPITRDIMRLPVTASSGKTYEASALRAHFAAQRDQGVQPTCPLTMRVLRPGQERPNRALQFTIHSAVKQAIAESGATEAEQVAMWARWLHVDA